MELITHCSPKVVKCLIDKNINDVLVVGGGVIPAEDKKKSSKSWHFKHIWSWDKITNYNRSCS